MDYQLDIAGTIFEGCYLMQIMGKSISATTERYFTGHLKTEEISSCRGISLARHPRAKIR